MTPEPSPAEDTGEALLRALVQKSQAVIGRVERLMLELASTNRELASTTRELASARQELARTEQELARTEQELASTAHDLAGATAMAQEAQLREATTRTELTLALNEALLAAADLKAALRAQGLAGLRVRPAPALRRRSVGLGLLLARLGALGHALVIRRSGVWRGTGRRFFDLRQMAAYAGRGAAPEIAPPALFDQAVYLRANPDVAAARMSPLVHYLLAGGRERRSPHPLFDDGWYRAQAGPAIDAAGVTPLEHYVWAGGTEGFSPHPLFDVAHYMAQAPELAAGETPLEHYLRQGWRDGLSPHPLFDPAWYATRAPGSAGVAPLFHYVMQGWADGASPHPLFAPRWYVEQAPDAADEGDPLVHFLVRGGFEGRSPGPWFDLPHYVAARGAALRPGVNPLVDYLQGGAWAVAEAKPGFPTAGYLASRLELVRQGLTPLEHWARLALPQARPAAAEPPHSSLERSGTG